MYSINVFLTFSLSMFGMLQLLGAPRGAGAARSLAPALGPVRDRLPAVRDDPGITILEKFTEGGWLTLVVTGALVALCFVIRKHYRTAREQAGAAVRRAEVDARRARRGGRARSTRGRRRRWCWSAGYGGLGIHTMLNVFRVFPGYFKNLVFVSVGVVDSGEFKGEGGHRASCSRGPRSSSGSTSTSPAGWACRPPPGSRSAPTRWTKAERLCLEVAREFPRATFFAGKVIFQREAWYQHLLHNETAAAIQKRLQWAGKPVVIIPARVH